MYSNNLKIEKVWRIILAVISCQAVGAAISFTIVDHHHTFLVFWLGGAFGTLPGYLFGLIWQTRAMGQEEDWGFTAILLGFISFILLLGALWLQKHLSFESSELERLAELKELRFDQMDIYENCGRKRLLSITNSDDIDVFTQAVGSAVGHVVEGDHYTDAWFVVLGGKSNREFVLYFKEGMASHVVGAVAYRQGGMVYRSVRFNTPLLRSWAETHLPHSPNRNC